MCYKNTYSLCFSGMLLWPANWQGCKAMQKKQSFKTVCVSLTAFENETWKKTIDYAQFFLQNAATVVLHFSRHLQNNSLLGSQPGWLRPNRHICTSVESFFMNGLLEPSIPQPRIISFCASLSFTLRKPWHIFLQSETLFTVKHAFPPFFRHFPFFSFSARCFSGPSYAAQSALTSQYSLGYFQKIPFPSTFLLRSSLSFTLVCLYNFSSLFCSISGLLNHLCVQAMLCRLWQKNASWPRETRISGAR